MQELRSTTLRPVIQGLAILLILKVAVSVVMQYRDYLPPNFNSDFLRGRERYFFGSYQWAFYVHIASGPVALLLGLALIGERLRREFPRWHRRLGRIQVAVVLMLVTPSGLWMACQSDAGWVASVGFASLAIVTAAFFALGWRAAVQRRFAAHRLWMWRGFLLLCSAIVIRMIGGLTTVMGAEADWIYPLAAWASWLTPLAAFELRRAGMSAEFMARSRSL